MSTTSIRARATTSRRIASPSRVSKSPTIALSEFASRREKLLKALDGSVGLVVAGDGDANGHHPFEASAHFLYLTGIRDEAGASLLFDPRNPNPKRRMQLFLRPLNPEREKWDGFRPEIGAELRARAGFETIFRSNMLPMQVLDAARRSRQLSLLMPLSQHTMPISSDLEIFRRVMERVPGCTMVDRSQVLLAMRARKSAAEVACIEHAGHITGLGFRAAMSTLRPGMNESQLQRAVEDAYHHGGARDLAFPTIAGGGFNSTVLHYRANDQELAAGDLVCLDSGAKWQGYSADVTRTLPVSGQFSRRQKEVYEVVLAAQSAAIKACKPGRRIHQVDDAARAVIHKAGFGDWFIHGIGHHLGLETHDANPDEPLADGAVITLEPGIYIPSERIGIRIEDDVLVTRRGPRTLTSHIAKSVADIERLMRRRA